MSALAATETRRKRKRRERLEERDATIPVELYGLKRGTIPLLTTCCVLFAVFTLIPIVWIVINSTKTQANIFGSFGFWFARPFEFFHTFANLFRDVDGDGTYSRWFYNTVLYSVVAGVGATVLAALGGYGFARFEFRGSRLFFAVIIAGLLVPVTLVAVPLYLVYAKVHLINSIWGMIMPSMVTPVGLYLMRTFVELSIPRELLDAARIDGASEVRIFFRVALPLMVPGLMTVLLLSIAGTWNNYILPLIIFSTNNLFPTTVGMGLWLQHAGNSGDTNLFPLLVMGGLMTIIPMVALFAVLQRYWRGGLLLGGVAN
jgi:multiple sugar transport system permease protein